jgi:hypothetical protein
MIKNTYLNLYNLNLKKELYNSKEKIYGYFKILNIYIYKFYKIILDFNIVQNLIKFKN